MAGLALADLICKIRQLAPSRPVHLFCHSLGARVALASFAHLPQGAIGRVILLNPAEFGTITCTALATPAGSAAEVFNITSRENDLFDFLLEQLVAAPERRDRSVALSMPRQPNTLTLQLDHAETLGALNRAGFPIAPPIGLVCHWSAYLRPGVFSLYRALLRQPNTMSQARLRTLLPMNTDPRWSRVFRIPELNLPMPARRSA